MKLKSFSRYYLICNKNKKRLIKEKLRALKKTMIFVESLYEADQVLVIGDITKEMQHEISDAGRYGMTIEKISEKELDTFYIQERVLQNELDSEKKYSREYGREYEF